MIIALNLFVAIIGLVWYGYTANGKSQAIALAMFYCGLFNFLLCICLHRGEKILGILAN